jgi:hypothetical protein
MPLLPGKANVGPNITELEEHGSIPRSHAQILAIALHTALDKHKAKKKATPKGAK